MKKDEELMKVIAEVIARIDAGELDEFLSGEDEEEEDEDDV